MMRTRILGGLLAAGLIGVAGCASTPHTSQQLVDARRAYAEAAAGPAPEHARTDFLEAERLLHQAEVEHREDPGSSAEQQLAYLAMERAQFANERARAVTAGAQAQQVQTVRTQRVDGVQEIHEVQEGGAKVRVKVTQRERELQLQQRQAELERQRAEAEAAARRNQQLAQEQQRQLEQQRAEAAAEAKRNQQLAQEQQRELEQREAEIARQQQELREERQAREQLERERDQALDRVREFAQVVETERGTVITLGSALLFRFDEATLLPTAKEKLDQVATALRTLRGEESLEIEGHADSTGTSAYNRMLSRERAEAVRDYLVSRGVPPERVIARGHGEADPVASNATAEGRANNRRVEVVIRRPTAAIAE